MLKVSASEFQNNVGQYVDTAQSAPVTITRHGKDKAVLLSAAEYRRLTQSIGGRSDTAAGPRASYFGSDRSRVSAPVSTALSVINTSTPVSITKRELLDAIRNPKSKYKAQARLLLNEVKENVLAALVTGKFATWEQLANLAERVGVDSNEKATFIRKMAGHPLD